MIAASLWIVLPPDTLAAQTDGAACEAEAWPAAVPRPPLHPDTEAFVNRLLSQMTLEEKVAQMIQADIGSTTPADLVHYRLGAILAGGNAAPNGNLRTTPQAWLDLANAYALAAQTPNAASHAPIPILFGIDAVHGDAKIVGATIFPHNVGLGATRDPDLVRRIGAATAAEVASTGIDWTFAPTVAVARDVRWGRSYESYSENPGVVAAYAAAMVTGLQGVAGTDDFLGPGHTLASVKHFLGDGATRDGRDQGQDAATAAQLREIHGQGYGAALDAGAMIVMASYNSWHGVKMHANHCLLTDVLKGRLGFNGFVVGDWNAQEQIPGCTKYRCPAAILAGVDMLMAPDSWRELYTNTLQEVRDGTIPTARIDDAVTRILRVKALAGLFTRANPAQRPLAGDFAQLGSAAHRALAREAVRRSLVLLKNAHATLPLRPQGRYLVVGADADDIGAAAGGWTIDWQGDHNVNADFPGATSIYAGIAAAVRAAGGTVERATDEWAGTGDASGGKPDAAIIVFGESPYAEFEGDRETLNFSAQDAASLAVMHRLRAQGIPVVAVFLSGRPLWVNPELNAADAFVAAWLPGSEGEGIADVLFRAPDGSIPFDFTGKLGFSWPATALPVRYSDDGSVQGALFPYGYGLSYATAAKPLQPWAQLNEQAPTPVGRGDSDQLFFAQHVVAPWSLFVADATDQVRLTTDEQASPHAALRVSLGAGGALARWDGTQKGLLTIAGKPTDLRARAASGWAVTLRYRVLTAPTAPVFVGIRCAAAYQRNGDATDSSPAGMPAAAPADPGLCGTPGGAMLDLTAVFARRASGDGAASDGDPAAAGAWRTLSLPLACWQAQHADLRDVEAPLAIATGGKFALEIGAVRLAKTTGGVCDVASLQQNASRQRAPSLGR
jgi:beta-glucosidase